MKITAKQVAAVLLVLAIVWTVPACETGRNENDVQKPVVIEIERWYPTDVEFPLPEDDKILKTIREQLNIELKYTFSTGKSNGWRLKLGSRIASGDLPDVIYFFNMMDYRTAQSQGYIIPLNDWIGEGRLPSNLTFITEDMLRYMADDEGIFHGIPNKIGPSIEELFVRKDWLDNLKLKPPQTAGQFAEVAYAFARRDPDGNGKDDTYGFTTGSCMSCQDFWDLISAFTGLNSPDEYWHDGQLRGGWTSPEYRAYLEFMQRLMSGGALDPDLVTNDINRKRQKIIQGQVGMFHFTGYPRETVQQLKKLNPEAEIMYLPPLTGPAGLGSHWPKVGVTTAVGITPKAGNDPVKVAKIIELINWMYSDEGRKLLHYGIEGINHRKAGKRIELIPGNQNDYLEVYSLIGERSNFMDDTMLLDAVYPDPAEADIVRRMIRGGGERGSIYREGYARERPALINNLKLFREEMAAKFIYSPKPIDDQMWDAYVDDHDNRYNGAAVRRVLLEDLEKAGLHVEP